MRQNELILLFIPVLLISSAVSYFLVKGLKNGFLYASVINLVCAGCAFHYYELLIFLKSILVLLLPIQLVNLCFYVFMGTHKKSKHLKEFRMTLNVVGKELILENIKRGISIIGASGSGKTESVVYQTLVHFSNHGFCGVIHDYKHFEITEMCYPLFENSATSFYIISFDPIYHKVNPIAPKYIPDEESVYEISRVLLENLLEIKESGSVGVARFFNDAAEGLISGIIWRLKTDYKEYCTIPHLIALYQYLTTKALVRFLKVNLTSKAMADAFISGIDSDRQTAGIRSTLANAFKKISTHKIFMVLSADEVPLDVNNPSNQAVISLVNNPKRESSLAPVIATIMHTITKQMCERKRSPSFVLMEEASTIRLLNMHRIPATLRSYNIVCLYVLQDKIQNDIMYGDKASKAILSNLSYQFFGKANDPDTARYYERFFEIVKKQTISINKGHNLNFDTRVTEGEKEVAKTRAAAFYGLNEGEFIVFADGKDRKVQFMLPHIKRSLPKPKKYSQKQLQGNFDRIHSEVRSIFVV